MTPPDGRSWWPTPYTERNRPVPAYLSWTADDGQPVTYDVSALRIRFGLAGAAPYMDVDLPTLVLVHALAVATPAMRTDYPDGTPGTCHAVVGPRVAQLANGPRYALETLGAVTCLANDDDAPAGVERA